MAEPLSPEEEAEEREFHARPGHRAYQGNDCLPCRLLASLDAERARVVDVDRLPTEGTLREWQADLRQIDRTLDRVLTSPDDGHIPIWSREDRTTIQRLINQMDATLDWRAREYAALAEVGEAAPQRPDRPEAKRLRRAIRQLRDDLPSQRGYSDSIGRFVRDHIGTLVELDPVIDALNALAEPEGSATHRCILGEADAMSGLRGCLVCGSAT